MHLTWGRGGIRREAAAHTRGGLRGGQREMGSGKSVEGEALNLSHPGIARSEAGRGMVSRLWPSGC